MSIKSYRWNNLKKGNKPTFKTKEHEKFDRGGRRRKRQNKIQKVQ